MKKKIRELTLEDMPNCWNKLFNINEALMVLFTDNEEQFSYAKSTIPDEILEIEITLGDKMKLTLKDCNNEIRRIAMILCYSKYSKEEEIEIKKQLRIAIERYGKVEQEKKDLAEARRADREARKLGIRR